MNLPLCAHSSLPHKGVKKKSDQWHKKSVFYVTDPELFSVYALLNIFLIFFLYIFNIKPQSVWLEVQLIN